MGRYIIATRDLKPGELILAEAPLVIAPMAVTPPVCLVCYKPVDGRQKYVHIKYSISTYLFSFALPITFSKSFFRCPLCGWPMCNDTCSSSISHQPECNLSRARGSPIKLDIKNASKPFPLYEAVALLRCMSLKNTDPDKYKSILQLESHKEERIRTGR